MSPLVDCIAGCRNRFTRFAFWKNGQGYCDPSHLETTGTIPLPITLLTSPGQLADVGANNASLCGDLDLSDGFFDNLKLK